MLMGVLTYGLTVSSMSSSHVKVPSLMEVEDRPLLDITWPGSKKWLVKLLMFKRKRMLTQKQPSKCHCQRTMSANFVIPHMKGPSIYMSKSTCDLTAAFRHLLSSNTSDSSWGSMWYLDWYWSFSQRTMVSRMHVVTPRRYLGGHGSRPPGPSLST